MRLSQLHSYPVKSCKGFSVDSILVGPKGPDMDRRWMLIDSNDRFISQRLQHKMALIEVSLEPNSLHMRIPDHADFHLPVSHHGKERLVTVWNDQCVAIDQGDEISQALSEFLKVDCRLVFMPDQTFRQVNQKYATSEKEEVGFADGYPFLLISEASLEDLNSRLEHPVPMNRFRPNLVIKGCKPYEEDTWKKIRIGEIVFQVAKPCARCVITTIDQDTGLKRLEPLKTLAGYRKAEKGILFGQNLIHHNNGLLRLGDTLEVLEGH